MLAKWPSLHVSGPLSIAILTVGKQPNGLVEITWDSLHDSGIRELEGVRKTAI